MLMCTYVALCPILVQLVRRLRMLICINVVLWLHVVHHGKRGGIGILTNSWHVAICYTASKTSSYPHWTPNFCTAIEADMYPRTNVVMWSFAVQIVSGIYVCICTGVCLIIYGVQLVWRDSFCIRYVRS